MATNFEVIAGDECVCLCHRDPSVHHVAACCADCAHCRTRVRADALATHPSRRCAGFRIGRVALRADAVVCVLAGLALIVTGFARSVLPLPVHLLVGVIVGLWGVGLWLAPARWPLRAVLAVVAAVNLLALLVLDVVALMSHGPVRTVALAAAVVVLLFAVVQWLALRRTQN